MCVVDIIKSAREQQGINQNEIAVRVGVAPSTYGAYERKERYIPDDVVKAIATELGEPSIIAELTYERNTEFFNVPLLNNVDTHPQVVIDSLIEEASEMIKALMIIKKITKNRTNVSQITTEQYKNLMDAEEQVGDVYSALKMHFVTMDRYGVNVKEVEKRCNRKLINKGYVRGNRQKKEALI
ncbi:MAG: helix-turn-helix domain-containing protein [Vallitalea sp.]|jgi:transcriptional regulator with XRE-family HTH domain|nr:helix-turn-helix domain-containing protein [Vallitalea sp.]